MILAIGPRGLATAVMAFLPAHAGIPGTELFPLYALILIGLSVMFMTIIPEVRIRRMDRESVSNESRAKTIRRSAWSGEAEVLLGTQLLFNGPPLPRVGMVGVPQADIGLHVPDFRAGERTYHALCRAMELCRPQEDGETEEGGTMVVQTFVPFHHAMAAIQAHDPSIFYHQELENRRPLGYPPFGSLMVLRVSGDDPARVEHASQYWRALLAENVSPESEAGRGTLRTMALPGDLNFGSSLQIMGPIPSKEKLPRYRHRWQLLVKSAQGDLARRRVHDTLRELEGSRKWAGMTFDVDVDSWEME